MHAAVLAAAVLLAGCAVSTSTRLYQLHAQAPVSTGPLDIPSGWTWQLAAVQIPEHLGRDAIVVPVGPAGWQAHTGHRWAESLRSSVPRILKRDLATLLGSDRVWTEPLPSGVVATRLIRLELLAFEPLADLSGVRLHARWSVLDSSGAMPPRNEQAELIAASAGRDMDSLVVAHRLALWRLAERLAGVPATPAARNGGR